MWKPASIRPAANFSFQEYFVQRWYQDPVNSVRFAGSTEAEPAPGVIEAIVQAHAVILAPSNPITSIGPILSVPGIREALARTKATVAAVSPIVATKPRLRPCGNPDGSHGPSRFHRRRGPSIRRFS